MIESNAIVQLCVAGMEAEGKGSFDEALALFTRAWEMSTDDFDRCVAAHYLARRQASPSETFRWNQEALDLADGLRDSRADELYPSLYLNMGKSCEDLGKLEEARRYYELAASRITSFPDSPYRAVVQDGIARGIARAS